MFHTNTGILLFLFAAFFPHYVHSQQVDTLIFNGPSTNRIDLTQMGDGWVTALDAPVMIPELESQIKTFFSLPEYHRYAKFFNVYRVEHFRSGPPAGTNWETKENADYYVKFINTYVPATDVRFVVSREGKGHDKILDGTNTDNWSDRVIAAPALDPDMIAEHLFGHAWHRLGDIYDGTNSSDYWINKTNNSLTKKWERWMGFVEPYNHLRVGIYPIANSSAYRELNSTKTLMADIWDYKTTPIVHTPVEREKVIHDFYALVRPLDSYTANNIPLVNPMRIEVKTVDPAVIQVDWYVDEKLVAKDGGAILNPGNYGSILGQHAVRAHAFDRVLNYTNSDRLRGKSDSLDWVRDDFLDMQQDVSWAVNITKVVSLESRNVKRPLVRHFTETALVLDFPSAGKYSVDLFSMHGEKLSELGSGYSKGNQVTLHWDGRNYRTQIVFIRVLLDGNSTWHKWIGRDH